MKKKQKKRFWYLIIFALLALGLVCYSIFKDNEEDFKVRNEQSSFDNFIDNSEKKIKSSWKKITWEAKGLTNEITNLFD